jgi:hypothetical protein
MMTQEQQAKRYERQAEEVKQQGHPRTAALMLELARRHRWLGWFDDKPPSFSRRHIATPGARRP